MDLAEFFKYTYFGLIDLWKQCGKPQEELVTESRSKVIKLFKLAFNTTPTQEDLPEFVLNRFNSNGKFVLTATNFVELSLLTPFLAFF